MPTLVYRKDGRPNAHVFGAHEAPIIIGRGLDCAIVVTDGSVSRKHAEIFTLDNGATWYVRDLQSANGCFVNGHRIQKARLVDGDTLNCGQYAFEFRRGPDTSHVAMTGNSAFFRKERVTPVRSSGVVGSSFRVKESGAGPKPVTGPQHISPEIRGALMSVADARRIQQLEEKLRTVERENLRLRAAIHALGKLTGADFTRNDGAVDVDVETFRRKILQTTRTLPSSAIAAIAQVIRTQRQVNGALTATVETPAVKRERAITEDED